MKMKTIKYAVGDENIIREWECLDGLNPSATEIQSKACRIVKENYSDLLEKYKQVTVYFYKGKPLWEIVKVEIVDEVVNVSIGVMNNNDLINIANLNELLSQKTEDTENIRRETGTWYQWRNGDDMVEDVDELLSNFYELENELETACNVIEYRLTERKFKRKTLEDNWEDAGPSEEWIIRGEEMKLKIGGWLQIRQDPRYMLYVEGPNYAPNCDDRINVMYFLHRPTLQDRREYIDYIKKINEGIK